MSKTEKRTAAKRKAAARRRAKVETIDRARVERDRKLSELGNHYSRELARLHAWYAAAKQQVWSEYRAAVEAAREQEEKAA